MPISKHEEKMVNLQYQLRQNQSELQDFLADLDNWESDIKQKEEQLKTGQGAENQKLPPVRNTIHKKKLKKKKKEKPADPSKPKRISGYDFRAWDKFDVDKALEDIDEKDQKKKEERDTSSSEYETDEEWEIERKKHLAGLEKDKGNDLLKNGEYEQAVEAYTRGIGFDPTNAILPANRALAMLKQQKFAAAELDCTTSISLDPLYVKAYLRRATARSGIGKLAEAVSDYNRILDLEPTNKQAKTELERLNKELERPKEGPVASSLTEGDKGIVKPIYKPPEERSKAPLRRIPIEEIGLEPGGRAQPASLEQSDTAKRITAKEGKEFERLFGASSSLPSPSEPHNQAHTSTHTTDDAVENASSRVPECSRLVTEVTDSTHSKVSDKGDATLAEKESKDLPELSKSSAVSETTKSISSDDASAGKTIQSVNKHSVVGNMNSEHSQHSTVPSLTNGTSNSIKPGGEFSVPQTSFQFQSDFKLLKNKPESFYRYLQAIPPAQYAKLFGQCLDADILNSILKCLAGYSDRGDLDVYEVLHELTKVKRFSMTAMFLSPKDKKVACDLVDQLVKKGSQSESELSALKRNYDL